MLLNTLAQPPKGQVSPAGHLCLLFVSSLASHLSHRLNPHKLLQYKALSSSTDFSLDLDHTLCSKPQDTPRLGGTGWPHTEPLPLTASAAFWDVPAASPCSMCHHFSLLSPGGHGKRMGVLGKQKSPHRAFHCVLPMSVCCGLFAAFLHRLDFLASPNHFLTDAGMFFLPGAKL